MQHRHSPKMIRTRCTPHGLGSRRLGGATLLALTLAANPARADLIGEYADRIDVDTEWLTGANNATDIAFADDGRALVTRKTGQVVIRRADGTLSVVDYPFGGQLDTDSEKGLLGVTADPNSPNTFYFYVSNGSSNADKHRVYRALLTEDDDLEVDDSPVVAEAVGNGPGLEGPANHDGGGMLIHDGYLYLSVGDTGANATPPTNKYSSCLNKGNGKILRVGLDGSIPDDNPLVGAGMVTGCDTRNGDWIMAAPDERVFAWGLRNPFRFWIDPQTDLMWIGDVGETTREEVTIGGSGTHHGYPFNEGFQEWRTSSDLDGNSDCMDIEPATSCTEPVHDYENPGQAGGGAAVTGGLIPEGCGWSNVFDGETFYLFGDSSLDWIHGLQVNENRTGVVSPDAVELGSYDNARPVAFKMGPDESLYIVFHGAGAVYRFTPADLTGDDCNTDPMGEGGAGAGGETGTAGANPGGGTGGAGMGGSSGAGMGGSGMSGGGMDQGVAGLGMGGNGMMPVDPEPGMPGEPEAMGMAGGGDVTPMPTNTGTAPTAPMGSGTAGAEDAGDVGDDGGSGDDGCGCRTVGSGPSPVGTLALGLGLLFVASRRRWRA